MGTESVTLGNISLGVECFSHLYIPVYTIISTLYAPSLSQ